jgi:hypothetical protein
MGMASGLILVCVWSTGCAVIAGGAHNACFETTYYLDDCLATIRHRKLAEEAWNNYCASTMNGEWSQDYADGFIAGFVDYLDAGGGGEPPPFPPSWYWKSRYQTAEGYKAIEDWYAGFRDGAGLARDSGYRQWLILPFSTPAGAPPPLPLMEPAPDESTWTPAVSPVLTGPSTPLSLMRVSRD